VLWEEKERPKGKGLPCQPCGTMLARLGRCGGDVAGDREGACRRKRRNKPEVREYLTSFAEQC